MHQAPEELESLLLSLPWNQTETCHFSHKQHINILETRMIQRELRDVVEKTVQPLRQVRFALRLESSGWSLVERPFISSQSEQVAETVTRLDPCGA